MNTNDNLMNNINTLWNTPEAELTGYGDGYCESIDRDQAVDDDGKAVYKSYSISIELGDGYTDSREVVINFSAEDMEAYARTW